MRQPLLTVTQGVDCLRAGKVIAYPTEAVYGLGCDAANESAVQTMLLLKNRNPDAGLILIAEHFDRLLPFVAPVTGERLAAALATWPGPVTWLFPRAPGVPDYLAGKHTTIALRVTAHPVCRSICEAFGGPIVSTSANPASAAPAVSPAQVTDYFADGICGIVEGLLGDQPNPSEIRDLSSGKVIRAA